jgi:hypothetical protein
MTAVVLFFKKRFSPGRFLGFWRQGGKISNFEELAATEHLPAEVRYVLAQKPSRVEGFRKILESGHTLEVRLPSPPAPRVMLAAERIARHGQRNMVHPWLHDLLHLEELPVFGEDALRRAQAQGVDLRAEAKIITEQEWEIIQPAARGESAPEFPVHGLAVLAEANADLRPLAADVFVRRVAAHLAGRPQAFGRVLLKAGLLVGPASHILELAAPGAGKFCAAVMGDLLGDAAEARALRASGFTRRQVMRRYRYLLLPLVLALFAAFQVELLIRSGQTIAAGVVFGLACCIVPLSAAFRSLLDTRRSLVLLARAGSFRQSKRVSLMGLAIRQESADPERIGLALSLVVLPLVSALVFGAAPLYLGNGWILAGLASLRPLVVALLVRNLMFIDGAVLKLKARRAFRASVLGKS